MPIQLTREEKRRLAREGSLVVPLPGTLSQPRRVYYDAYGAKHRLPSDAWSLEHYLNRGFMLQPPANPLIREAAELVGGDDWTGEKQAIDGEGKPISPPMLAGTVPTATYYTAEGQPIPNLPADPESMAAYLEQGLRLSPPAGAVERPEPRLRIVAAPEPRQAIRRRRYRRSG